MATQISSEKNTQISQVKGPQTEQDLVRRINNAIAAVVEWPDGITPYIWLYDAIECAFRYSENVDRDYLGIKKITTLHGTVDGELKSFYITRVRLLFHVLNVTEVQGVLGSPIRKSYSVGGFRPIKVSYASVEEVDFETGDSKEISSKVFSRKYYQR